jgi:hypothetical protein
VDTTCIDGSKKNWAPEEEKSWPFVLTSKVALPGGAPGEVHSTNVVDTHLPEGDKTSPNLHITMPDDEKSVPKTCTSNPPVLRPADGCSAVTCETKVNEYTTPLELKTIPSLDTSTATN